MMENENPLFGQTELLFSDQQVFYGIDIAPAPVL